LKLRFKGLVEKGQATLCRLSITFLIASPDGYRGSLIHCAASFMPIEAKPFFFTSQKILWSLHHIIRRTL